MKLQEIIKTKLDNYSNIDPKFRQLIYDHKTYIRNSSFKLNISPQIRDIYKYRNNKLILDNSQIKNLNLMWIIFFINNVDQLDYLGKLNVLYIPNEDIIKSLYKKYLMTHQ